MLSNSLLNISPGSTEIFVADSCKLFSFNRQFYSLGGGTLQPINSINYAYGDYPHSSSYKYLIAQNMLYRLNETGVNSINNIFLAAYININTNYNPL